jgi:hypothetical protein
LTSQKPFPFFKRKKEKKKKRKKKIAGKKTLESAKNTW